MRLEGIPRVLPGTTWRWGLGFLAVSLASCLLSVARGETLYLLLRGRVEPLVVNSLGMTAADRSLAAVRTFLVLVLVFLAADAFSRLARSPGGRRALLVAASAGAVLASLGALFRIGPMEGTSAYWKLVGRASGTFTDPNALGVGIALLVPLSVAALLEFQGVLRALPAAGLLLAPFALERSGSRSGLIVLMVAAIGAAIGGFRSGGRLRRGVIAAGGAALVLAALLVAVAPRGGPAAVGGLVQRVGGALSARSVVEVTSHRPLFWRTALSIISEEPLSGCGLGGFPFEFPVRYERAHGPALFTDNATNAFLDVAAESGLPALFLGAGALVPLLLLAAAAVASPWPGAGWAAAGGAAALVGLVAASLTGSHLRFPEVAICAGVAAAFLPFPPQAPGADAALAAGSGRVLPVLVATGVLAACLAALPSLRPEAPFREAGRGWIGVYPPEGSAGARRQWTGRRISRRLEEGESEARMTIENARPDGRPVLATFRVDDALAGTAIVPADGPRTFAVRPLPRAGGVLAVSFSLDFVPSEASASLDRRRLGVLLRSRPGERP